VTCLSPPSPWRFSFWSLAGSGYQAVYYGVFCLFLGVPVYVWMKVSRKEYGETPTPTTEPEQPVTTRPALDAPAHELAGPLLAEPPEPASVPAPRIPSRS
jgi:basic amino acid/polyamine antiporter, APA family